MIGLIAHSAKADAGNTLRAVVAALKDRGADYCLEAETASLLGEESHLDERAMARVCDVFLVMGGDGTILRVVHRLGPDIRPIFGINIGSLGFLTCVGPAEVERAVESLVKEDYQLSRRELLLAELETSGHTIKMHALNDVVISRGERSELVKISLSVDGAPLTDYNADGLIVATPTGSTAYSLSAGGPILMPESQCFVITPICPHVLTNRSTVVGNRSVIEARISQSSRNIIVGADGQEQVAMKPGDRLRISRARRALPLAMLPERQFPEVLREKLKWSGSNI